MPRTGGVFWKPSERLLPRRPSCSLALSSCSLPSLIYPCPPAIPPHLAFYRSTCRLRYLRRASAVVEDLIYSSVTCTLIFSMEYPQVPRARAIRRRPASATSGGR
ncbi:uncharacterized protein SCHCODRAFT_02613770 [Schizophyllum commune H4-8]|uniref:uncharacterized protein n=1 Tax=Schizophyllum commune (strain H4-8 / FGSC 9210) TaxID=578458 RepID=UPI00215F4B72|nr:uncharacterized protein SCHCODRAFT_02613770 [Schizophyllum commune H4-8]KAI5896001.1 hypothetical protein SCHCODRAFT_02613770 [Schizophyllum commune H4-8]